MKTLMFWVLFLGFTTAVFADDAFSFSINTNQAAVVKQRLEAFEKGTITLKEMTEGEGNEKCMELINYYRSNPNVSVKAKLPISRCFAISGEYQEAAQLAADYVQVYSNDWHGWKILGGANLKMGNVSEAIGALTNAADLGDESSHAPLAFAAINLDRLDIVSNRIPQLLIFKRKDPPPEIDPLDIVTVITIYAVKSNQKEIFIKALDGVTAKQILLRGDLTYAVKYGCGIFSGNDIERIRQGIEPENFSTNNISDPAH